MVSKSVRQLLSFPFQLISSSLPNKDLRIDSGEVKIFPTSDHLYDTRHAFLTAVMQEWLRRFMMMCIASDVHVKSRLLINAFPRSQNTVKPWWSWQCYSKSLGEVMAVIGSNDWYSRQDGGTCRRYRSHTRAFPLDDAAHMSWFYAVKCSLPWAKCSLCYWDPRQCTPKTAEVHTSRHPVSDSTK